MAAIDEAVGKLANQFKALQQANAEQVAGLQAERDSLTTEVASLRSALRMERPELPDLSPGPGPATKTLVTLGSGPCVPCRWASRFFPSAMLMPPLCDSRQETVRG